MKKFTNTLLFFIFTASIFAGEPWWDNDKHKAPIRKKEQQKARIAYEAFAQGDYDKAIAALKKLSVSPDERTSLKTMIKTWEKRKRLGSIKPRFVYRALVINLNHLNAKDHRGKHYNIKMTPEEIQTAELYQEMTKKTYEAFSDGEMSVKFERHYFNAPIKALTAPTGDGNMPRLDSVKGVPELLYKKAATYDLLVVHWPGGVHGTALGGGWPIPYIEGVLQGPYRGRLILNTWHNYGIWVHEMFHSMEAHSSIKAIHGYYSNTRGLFPDWKGESGDQFDYFQFQFDAFVKKSGYENLSFSRRYKETLSPKLFQKVLKTYLRIPLKNIVEGNALYYKGNGKRDPDEAIKLYRQALKLSPYHFKAMMRLGESLRARQKYKEAISWGVKAAEIYPYPFTLKPLAVTYQRAGMKKEAIKTLKQCTALDPDRRPAYLNARGCYGMLAGIYESNGLKKVAYEQITEAAWRGENRNFARQMIVRLQPESLRYPEAIKRYEKIFGKSWQYAQVLLLLSDKEKKFQDKMKVLNLALKISAELYKNRPSDRDTRVSYAQVELRVSDAYAQNGQKAKAYKHMKEVIKTGHHDRHVIARLITNRPKSVSMKKLKADVRRLSPDQDTAKKMIEALD